MRVNTQANTKDLETLGRWKNTDDTKVLMTFLQ